MPHSPTTHPTVTLSYIQIFSKMRNKWAYLCYCTRAILTALFSLSFSHLHVFTMPPGKMWFSCMHIFLEYHSRIVIYFHACTFPLCHLGIIVLTHGHFHNVSWEFVFQGKHFLDIVIWANPFAPTHTNTHNLSHMHDRNKKYMNTDKCSCMTLRWSQIDELITSSKTFIV